MALDEVLAREVGAGHRPPTLRIWEWSAPGVVIGSFQSLRNEVDVAEASRRGITVVRRISGGGAMFIEPGSPGQPHRTCRASRAGGDRIRAVLQPPASRAGVAARPHVGRAVDLVLRLYLSTRERPLACGQGSTPACGRNRRLPA